MRTIKEFNTFMEACDFKNAQREQNMQTHLWEKEEGKWMVSYWDVHAKKGRGENNG